MKRPRLILADDHVLLIDALKGLLDESFDIVGTFKDGQSLVENAFDLNPDVIILDIGMPGLNGLLAGQRVKTLLPRVKLIYLTMNVDVDVAAEAFKIGASGYLLKTAAGSELKSAINDVVLGRGYISPAIKEALEEKRARQYHRRESTPMLTSRQKEVLELLSKGHSMKEVAFQLQISPRTIAFHKYTMMEQLNLKSTADLIHFAVTHSIA